MSCVPRKRGDDPWLSRNMEWFSTVFPASVGMIPRPTRSADDP